MSRARTRDVVLLCNPKAGGRWRVLAEVLDSDEARGVRRIVTDEIDDVGAAISGLGQRVKLLCVYGGDGTIFRVIQELLRRPQDALPPLALLGGGTMNVTAAWCGMSESPAENFRTVMRAWNHDKLYWREVPVLAVSQDGRAHHGFTFGLGPAIRILQRYEEGSKGRASAVSMGLKSVGAALSRFPRDFQKVLEETTAKISVDGQELPHAKFAAVFANTTGQINRLVEPFTGARTRETFHFLAYAISSRELAMLAPLLARGKLPIDPSSLLRKVSAWRQALLSLAGKGDLPVDPRYVNGPAREVRIEAEEKVYTIDGELLPVEPGPIEVRLGPVLKLAVPRRAR